MITITAREQSDRIPRLLAGSRQGQVVDKYRTGCNMQFGDNLVFCGTGRRGVPPFGICLEEEDLPLLLDSLSPGDLVVHREQSLMIYTANGTLRLLWDSGRSVRLRLPAGTAALSLLGRLEKWCTHYISDKGIINRTGLPFLEKDATAPDDYFQALVQATEKEDLPALRTALSKILGRGPGLTPSGDDWLTGFLSAGWCSGSGALLEEALTETLGTASTTHVSRAYLGAALEGYFHSAITNFWQAALAGETPETLNRRADRLIQLGHTSGADTFCGIYAGVGWCSANAQTESSTLSIDSGRSLNTHSITI